MKIKAYGICVYKIEEDESIKILLCKASTSKEKWGFLKGVAEALETKEQTAIREFKEESSIIISQNYLEKYFEQQNKEKDIGIFLIDYKNIPAINIYFNEDQLYSKYLSWENTKVKFFSIDNLPKIRKKQKNIAVEITEYLKRETSVI